jgi:hypothetical protein
MVNVHSWVSKGLHTVADVDHDGILSSTGFPGDHVEINAIFAG